MNDIIAGLRQELKDNIDEMTRQSARKFFREEVTVYGIKSATVGKIGMEYFKKIKGRPKSGIYDLCDQLWQSGYLEESFIACNWSYYIHKTYESADFSIFENWVDTYVSNWASCDTFCNHTVGTFIEMFPGYISRLKEWAISPNRWMRRGSAVSLIVPARKGIFLNEIREIATILLMDEEDMVQKGYGWMLKAASQAHQKEVFDFVIRNKAKMPRTALRYAIEKMPANLKAMAMEK
ncbi:MAG TPA: DNA alkylation repair protein [Bacteroidales bacterium]|nr:DNA alkylation repair protein [Bacteroidales bacterium]